MRLQAGQTIPAFKAVTYDGRTIDSESLIGHKTWLCFYRYVGCPLCVMHLFEVSARQKELAQKGLQVIAVFESERLKFGKLQGKEFPQFPIVSDPGCALYEEFGVEKSALGIVQPKVAFQFVRALAAGFRQGAVDGDLRRIPAHFFVAEDGTLHRAFYGENIADHVAWNQVEEFIQAPARPVPEKKKGL